MRQLNIEKMLQLKKVAQDVDKIDDVLEVVLTFVGTFGLDEITDLLLIPARHHFGVTEGGDEAVAVELDGIDAFRQVYWDGDGQPLTADKIRLGTVLTAHRVRVSRPSVDGEENVLLIAEEAKIEKIDLEFNHKTHVDLTLRIKTVASGDEVGRVSELINHDVLVFTKNTTTELDFGE